MGTFGKIPFKMIRLRVEANAWLAVPRGPRSRKTRGRTRPFPASWPADDTRRDDIVSLPPLIVSLVQFLRTGYPKASPSTTTSHFFSLLARKLTSEEVVQVADELALHGDPISANASRQAIADLIHEQPLEADIARVSARLVAAGWQQSARNTPTTTRERERTDCWLKAGGR